MTIIQDIRSAVRTLRRSPTIAAPIVLSLAFAIGGNVAALSLVNTFFLRPPASPHGIRCTRRPTKGAGGVTDGANNVWYERVRARARTIDGTLLTFQDASIKVLGGQVERAQQCSEPCGVTLTRRRATSSACHDETRRR